MKSEMGLSPSQHVIAKHLITGCSHTDLGFLKVPEKMYSFKFVVTPSPPVSGVVQCVCFSVSK